MRASCGIDSDLALTERAFFRRGRCRCFLFVMQGVSQLIDEFYQTEDHKCCDQEIDDRCDKITVHQHRCGVTASQLHI